MEKTFLRLVCFVAAVLTIGKLAEPIEVFAGQETEIVVGYTEDGQMIREENGDYYGYGPDLLEGLAEYTGWTYRYVFVPEADRIKLLKEGTIDLLCNVDQGTAQEEGLYLSRRESGLMYSMLCAKKDNHEIFYGAVNDLQNKTIAINENAGLEPYLIQYANQNHITYESLYLGSMDEVWEALDSGAADIALVSNLCNLDQEHYKYVANLGITEVYFAMNEQNRILLKKLDEASEKLKSDRPFFQAGLYDTYYGRTAAKLVGMTRPEYELIQSGEKVRVAYAASNYPMEYQDPETGEYRGVYADVMHLIEEECGLEFEYIPMDNMREVWELMEAGRIDLIAAGFGNAEKAGYLNIIYSDPYMNVENNFIGRTTETLPEQARIAIPKAYMGLQYYMEELYPAWKPVLLDNEEECLQAVSQGRADVTIINTVFLQTVYNLNSYENLGILPAKSLSIPIRIGIGKKNAELTQQIINKALYRIPAAEFEKCVVENSINIFYEPNARDFMKRYSPHVAVIVMVIVLIFVISIKLRENHFRHLAMTDALTGLWNGTKFRREADSLLNRNRMDTFYMVSMDIDKFKFVNNDFGTEVADNILRIFAGRIREEFGDCAIFARDMADMFLIMVKPCDDLEIRLEHLSRQISFQNNGVTQEYRISLKFGICDIWPRATNAEGATYINYAVIARKSIKNVPGVSFAYYNNEMADSVAYEMLIEKKMVDALRNREFKVYYQPKYDLRTGRLAGAEALVRWQSEELGFVYPDSFIPIFEKNGFIIELDFYVYEEVLKKMAEWADAGEDQLCVSVNVSRAHLETNDFLDRLKILVYQYGISPDRLELELTETILGNKRTDITSFIKACKEVSFKVSIDDFGSGYSSLNLLKKLPVDILKIDKGFLDETEESERSSIIVEQVVEMARKISVETICEGVETQKQADFLKQIGCNMVQGYLYSRPVPVEEFEVLLGVVTGRNEIDRGE